jgi:hypothetical protein
VVRSAEHALENRRNEDVLYRIHCINRTGRSGFAEINADFVEAGRFINQKLKECSLPLRRVNVFYPCGESA